MVEGCWLVMRERCRLVVVMLVTRRTSHRLARNWMVVLVVPTLLVLTGAPIPGIGIGPLFPLIVATATTGPIRGHGLQWIEDRMLGGSNAMLGVCLEDRMLDQVLWRIECFGGSMLCLEDQYYAWRIDAMLGGSNALLG
jgi:hypothetical protein